MATKIAELFVSIGADTREFDKAIASLDSKTLQDVGKSMQDVGTSMSMYLTAPIAAFGAISVSTFRDFGASMNMVRGVTQASGEDFRKLEAQAKELGATTQFSALQAADAMTFLGMAGFKTEQIIAAMPGTLQLAASAQLDMAQAADIVTNILTGYNLEISELGKVNDVLVRAFTSANTNLQQLGEAMKYAAPVASAAGVAFEEATSALSLMGNAGVQASMAGTSLRGAISRILAPTKQMSDAMAQAGLNFTDAAGRLLPLSDIIEALEPYAEDAGLMMTLFGQRAGPAMAGLVSQGSDALRELTRELYNSEGAAAAMSESQMSGWVGIWEEFVSVLEGVRIEVGQVLSEMITPMIHGLTSLFQRFVDADPAVKKFIVAIGMVAAVVGPLLVTIGGIVSAVGSFGTIIAAVATPVGIAVAAITALGVAAASVYANWDKLSGWFSSSASPIFGQIGQTAKNTGSAISSAFASAWDGIKNAISSITGALEPQLKILSASFAALGQAIATALGFAATTIGNTLSAVVSVVGGALGAIGHLVAGIVQVLTGDFAGAWESLRSAAISVWDGLVRAFVAGVDTLLAGIGVLIGFLPGVSEGIDRARASLQGLIPVRDIQKDAETASGAIYGLGEAAIQVGAGIGAMTEKPRAGIGVLKNDITGLSTVLATVPEAAEKAGEGAAQGLEQPIESALDKIKQSLNSTMAVFDREMQLGVRMHMDDAATARVKHEIDSVRSAIGR